MGRRASQSLRGVRRRGNQPTPRNDTAIQPRLILPAFAWPQSAGDVLLFTARRPWGECLECQKLFSKPRIATPVLSTVEWVIGLLAKTIDGAFRDLQKRLQLLALTSGHHLPQHIRQQTAIAVILVLDAGIDTHQRLESRRVATIRCRGNSDRRTRDH